MIAATIKGCVQTGEDSFQDRLLTYLFEETATIENILKTTKQEDISMCNLSMVIKETKE